MSIRLSISSRITGKSSIPYAPGFFITVIVTLKRLCSASSALTYLPSLPVKVLSGITTVATTITVGINSTPKIHMKRFLKNLPRAIRALRRALLSS